MEVKSFIGSRHDQTRERRISTLFSFLSALSLWRSLCFIFIDSAFSLSLPHSLLEDDNLEIYVAGFFSFIDSIDTNRLDGGSVGNRATLFKTSLVLVNSISVKTFCPVISTASSSAFPLVSLLDWIHPFTLIHLLTAVIEFACLWWNTFLAKAKKMHSSTLLTGADESLMGKWMMMNRSGRKHELLSRSLPRRVKLLCNAVLLDYRRRSEWKWKEFDLELFLGTMDDVVTHVICWVSWKPFVSIVFSPTENEKASTSLTRSFVSFPKQPNRWSLGFTSRLHRLLATELNDFSSEAAFFFLRPGLQEVMKLILTRIHRETWMIWIMNRLAIGVYRKGTIVKHSDLWRLAVENQSWKKLFLSMYASNDLPTS